MLTLKRLKWSNCFSYGDNNVLELDSAPLTQLIGANGAGKTSIALMIQEILYGKNSKNIKKQDIVNNKSGKKGYFICLFFEKDGVDYSVHLTRTSNLKFKLYRGEEDISSHTSINTYKSLAEIIGIDDFKVFCQLIYQHSTDSLEFLTATDTNRKKFLISLLQLERYTELHEHFKDKVRVLSGDISTLEGGVNTIKSWIEHNENMDFVKRDILVVPEIDKSLISKISNLEKDITNINSINRKIVINNQHKSALNKLDSKYYLEAAPAPPGISSNDIKSKISVLEHDTARIKKLISKIKETEGTCQACYQDIDEDKKVLMLQEQEDLLREINKKYREEKEEFEEVFQLENEIRKHKKIKEEFIKFNQLIDKSLPAQTLDKNQLQSEVEKFKRELKTSESLAKSIEEENRKIAAHNSKVDVVKDQLEKMKKDLHEKTVSLVEKENLSYILELLKKTFSTNGLVSYKIESSVKELEKTINKYLAELTYFQIYFKLAGEKLNIEVVDDVGNVTSMSNLSSGEKARVNLATLLGIRNILSSLTNTKINLLFLDELTGSLDAEGKEKFTEILLQENLNTFFVSHEWTHPLVPQIHIVKEQHISRIENG
jgi:DNA repair exonuclease SbcCD ATPase subunit